MPGMKMNLNVIQEKNERIVQISFCLRNPLSHLEKKIIKNILSDKVYAPYKVLYAMIDTQLIVFICEVLICTFLIRIATTSRPDSCFSFRSISKSSN